MWEPLACELLAVCLLERWSAADARFGDARLRESNPSLARQPRPRQALAHVLPIGWVSIVQRADEGLTSKSRLSLQPLAGVCAGRGAIAELRRRRRQESVVRVVGRGKLAVGCDRVGIDAG